jgi:hypothetical protein
LVNLTSPLFFGFLFIYQSRGSKILTEFTLSLLGEGFEMTNAGMPFRATTRGIFATV